MGGGEPVSRPYDLIDLFYDHGSSLPPELRTLAFELLLKEPSRMLDARREEVLDAAADLWTQQLPTPQDVEALANFFDSLTLEDELANQPDLSTEELLMKYPLVYFIANYTKRARPSHLFSTGFKLVNMAMMPRIIRLFNKKKV